ncbi:hypothetical protein LY76DRAFT_610085 [Colletotrichum caudatum]|nr:hypothetical protein LY76DRAFT_610085 [Colletotrichum caudatum]
MDDPEHAARRDTADWIWTTPAAVARRTSSDDSVICILLRDIIISPGSAGARERASPETAGWTMDNRESRWRCRRIQVGQILIQGGLMVRPAGRWLSGAWINVVSSNPS